MGITGDMLPVDRMFAGGTVDGKTEFE